MSLAAEVWAVCVVSGKPLRSDGAPRLSTHHLKTDQYLILFFWLSERGDRTGRIRSRKASTTRYHITTVSI